MKPQTLENTELKSLSSELSLSAQSGIMNNTGYVTKVQIFSFSWFQRLEASRVLYTRWCLGVTLLVS